MRVALNWLDQRTGYKALLQNALFENIPGGSRWRYVWGSTLTFGLVVQFVTGLCLWMSYSPSSQTAWESVYYIQESMSGGWLLRGIHHHTASVMNVLLVLHLMQVLIDGAYRAPREVNFWFGLGLLMLVLGLSLTGYLLPWDQKGYWATKVATNIAAIAPVIGAKLQRVIIGGPDYGHHTLTRFFALHAGFLPACVILLLVWHIMLFRRHGIKARNPRHKPDAYFWPDQVLKDAVACLAVMAAVLFLILRPWLFNTGEDLGAELGAPADASESYAAARPEWYFLFLFQFLKWFPSGTEVWGAIVIPTIVLGVMFLMPLLGRWELGHRFNLGFMAAILLGAALLTYLARAEDSRNDQYQAAVQEADRNAHRVRVLAKSLSGIPVTGAVTLLRDDPLTQGPKLFARNCAICHRYGGHDGTGLAIKDPPTASDLKGFASREWIAGLLDPQRISTPQYFGATKFKDGKMAKFIHRDVPSYSAEDKAKLHAVTVALSAEAELDSQHAADLRDRELVEQGRTLLLNSGVRCTECHQFRNRDEDATAPDLTGYGSRAWLTAFVGNPAHERFYGKRNDGMPAFQDRLDEHSIGLVVDWLRGHWYRPDAADHSVTESPEAPPPAARASR
jgi:ubiquinol-cytochrome c reductase cytochrome b subunit